MKKINLSILALLIAAAAVITSSCNMEKKPEKAQQIPLEDFFKNPEKTAYQISPDGNYYSYLAPYESRLNVFVQERGKEEAIRITSETDRDIAGYFWPNNEQILYLKDDGGNENYKLYGANIDGSEVVCFTDFEDVRTQITETLPEIEDEVIIEMNKRNPQVFDPYRLNIKTGEMEMLAENPGNIQGWMFDHDGKLRVAFAITDGVNVTYMYRETEQDDWSEVLTTSFKDELSPRFFDFENKNVIATSNLGRDKSAVVVFDIANGEEVEELYSNPDYDVQGVNFSRKDKKLTSASYTSWKRERHFFDDETKKLYERIEQGFG